MCKSVELQKTADNPSAIILMIHWLLWYKSNYQCVPGLSTAGLDCCNFQLCQIWQVPCESYFGVTNLGCLFIEPCKCSAHKAGQKVLPPPEKQDVSSRLSMTSGKVRGIFSRWVHAVGIVLFYKRLLISVWRCNTFSLSLITGNVVGSWCDCMQLCSQGPHLWPFISSQVKGLRDNEARRQMSSSTGEIRPILTKHFSVKCVCYLLIWICAMYVYYELFSHLN